MAFEPPKLFARRWIGMVKVTKGALADNRIRAGTLEENLSCIRAVFQHSRHPPRPAPVLFLWRPIGKDQGRL